MPENRELRDNVLPVTLKLLAYCMENGWAGYDPYDALNSRIFETIPGLDSKIPRLVLTQALKRSPINIRRPLLIPKTQNAKALALFLTALLNLAKVGHQDSNLIEYMIHRLRELRSPGSSHWCWGYSFPWQTRTIIVPTTTPNLVCTTFVATSLLNVYDFNRDPDCLKIATSAADYIMDELYWTRGDEIAGFSYPLPTRQAHIHNANLLGAALLCRVSRLTGERKYLAPALKVTRHSVSQQRPDGSWYYGEELKSQWIDNFHTGYNLGALRSIGRDLQTGEFDLSVQRGFEFYRSHFFREDGAPRYFHNRTYPIDVHCVAQSILTLVEFADHDAGSIELVQKVFQWARRHMWDDRGYFYYRVLRFCTIKTPYMRWSQAWMLIALSTLLSASSATTTQVRHHHSLSNV